MTYKTLSFILAAVCALPLSVMAQQENAEPAELSGDTKLACEAILCLSSGERPSECSPSLNHYFNIVKKTVSKTLSARRDFLSLCPVVSENSDMKQLVSAIAQGAGRCDANYLNQTLREEITLTECQVVERVDGRWVSRWEIVSENFCEEPRIRTITVIDNTRPAYCAVYENHEWTYKIGVEYVGNRLDGGHWEDL
jgi:hypothetical protein